MDPGSNAQIRGGDAERVLKNNASVRTGGEIDRADDGRSLGCQTKAKGCDSGCDSKCGFHWLMDSWGDLGGSGGIWGDLGGSGGIWGDLGEGKTNRRFLNGSLLHRAIRSAKKYLVITQNHLCRQVNSTYASARCWLSTASTHCVHKSRKMNQPGVGFLHKKATFILRAWVLEIASQLAEAREKRGGKEALKQPASRFEEPLRLRNHASAYPARPIYLIDSCPDEIARALKRRAPDETD